MSLTTDPKHPGLGHGFDESPRPQMDVYLVLSPEELAKGYVKPYRTGYTHDTCGVLTRMGHELSATYARNPWFYGATYCCGCHMHRPLSEFHWDDGEPMDPRKWPEAEHQRIADLREIRQVQPLNDLTLEQIMADVAAGARIEKEDPSGFDQPEYRLIKGSYEVAPDTIRKLLKLGVIEPFANGCGWGKARVPPAGEEKGP